MLERQLKSETFPGNEVITEEEYREFIRTGKVPSQVVEELAFKIMRKEQLSSREISLYSGDIAN